jgi:outer membrane protein
MVQTIVNAWNGRVTAERNLAVGQSQLGAAKVLNEGMFAEYRAGLRSTFDLLFAQNNLRDTQISLLSSARDLYVAEATLARHIGSLEVAKLMTGNGLYDPAAHVRAVQRRGALPWDGVIRAIDQRDLPNQHQQAIDQPPRINDTPAIVLAKPIPFTLPLVTNSPTMPAPGTIGRPLPEKQP